MKKIGLFFLTSALLLCINNMLPAQIITNRIIVANGGAYSDPNDFVTLTAYDPVSGITENVATIFSQSVQGLFIHQGFAYLAAQDSLAKINIDEGTVDAIIALPGVNKFAIYENKLLVSRQYPVTSDFVQIRHVSDLSLIASFPEISDESWEILVACDTAYISVAGGWAATEGKMAVLDLRTNSFVRETNFGAMAMGIGPSFLDQNNILFVCKTPWGGSSGTIVKYNISTCQYETVQIPLFFGEAAGIIAGKLFLIINQGIGMVDTETLSVMNANLITNPFSNLDITGLALDIVQGKIYVNYSWWVAPPGTGIIYDLNGVELGNYEVGISAEEIAVDYRPYMRANHVDENQKMCCYPNPCNDFLYFTNLPDDAHISVFDISGRQVVDFETSERKPSFIDFRNLSNGVYLLKIASNQQANQSEAGFYLQKIIKNQ